MENKINIAELLKDCPKGMELDCTMYEDVYFDYVDELNIIHCYIKDEGLRTSLTFNQFGTPDSIMKSKCVIFPKGKTTWKGFYRPFKDGDIVATKTGNWIGITDGGERGLFIPTYCIINCNDKFKAYFGKKDVWAFNRLATEEEKQKLFKAIKENGYHWNTETKTLEKLIEPKFKVGDIVKSKNCPDTSGFIITDLKEDGYSINIKNCYIKFKDQDNYELVSNKFDINTLVPFESRVLVRDCIDEKWCPGIWGFYNKNSENYPYVSIGERSRYCIPYKGNEHLLDTTNDCDDYYKTWEPYKE